MSRRASRQTAAMHRVFWHRHEDTRAGDMPVLPTPYPAGPREQFPLQTTCDPFARCPALRRELDAQGQRCPAAGRYVARALCRAHSCKRNATSGSTSWPTKPTARLRIRPNLRALPHAPELTAHLDCHRRYPRFRASPNRIDLLVRSACHHTKDRSKNNCPF